MKWLLKILRWVLSPVDVTGRRLDPDVQAVLYVANKRPSLETYPPSRARIEALRGQRLMPKPHVPVHTVEDFAAAGLPMRRYQPAPTPSEAGLLFFHGGGFVIGGLDSHDHLCRALAKHGGCDVVAVDYRLAPEHPFPAAVEDALAAWQWFEAQPFGRRLVGGDSAGGNLAAVVCQQASSKPAGQLLIYPATDRHTVRPSRTTFAHGFLYTEAMSAWFKAHYLAEHLDRRNEQISPIFREDLSDQPPAHIVLAGFDILHDEGRAYANKLQEAGVPVIVQFEETLIHGFTALAGVCPAAISAIETAGRSLRRLGVPGALDRPEPSAAATDGPGPQD